MSINSLSSTSGTININQVGSNADINVSTTLTRPSISATTSLFATNNATIGTLSVASQLQCNAPLLLHNNSSSGSVTLASPSTNFSNWTCKFPNGPGSASYVLSTDGSGNCTWASPNSGTIQTITSDNSTLTITDSTGPSTNIVVCDPLNIGSVVSTSLQGQHVIFNIPGQGVTTIYPSNTGFTDYDLTLPTSQCPTNGYLLSSNTSGQLGWSAPGISPTTGSGTINYSSTIWGSGTSSASFKFQQIGDYVTVFLSDGTASSTGNSGYIIGTWPTPLPPVMNDQLVAIGAWDVTDNVTPSTSTITAALKIQAPTIGFSNGSFTIFGFDGEEFNVNFEVGYAVGIFATSFTYYVGA